MSTSYLYLVENRTTGACYVGFTSKSPEKRWANHVACNRPRSRYHFQNAIRKYGREAFDWRVVETFDSAEEAKLAEIYWIARLRDFGVDLYNLTDGGEGCTGLKVSNEAKAKQSAAMRGRPSPRRGCKTSDETKAKQRAAKLGKPSLLRGRRVSAEAKAKQSAAMKGRPSPLRGRRVSAEAKAKQSAAMKGRPSPLRGRRMSEEQKAKLRKPKSAEHRAKLSAANLGKPAPFKGRRHTEEAKAKQSAAKKGKPSPFRGCPRSEETKEKIRQTLKRLREEGCENV